MKFEIVIQKGTSVLQKSAQLKSSQNESLKKIMVPDESKKQMELNKQLRGDLRAINECNLMMQKGTILEIATNIQQDEGPLFQGTDFKSLEKHRM